jgi:hypothetical protein
MKALLFTHAGWRHNERFFDVRWRSRPGARTGARTPMLGRIANLVEWPPRKFRCPGRKGGWSTARSVQICNPSGHTFVLCYLSVLEISPRFAISFPSTKRVSGEERYQNSRRINRDFNPIIPSNAKNQLKRRGERGSRTERREVGLMSARFRGHEQADQYGTKDEIPNFPIKIHIR